ncbi:hypothetical protein KKE06_05955 [Candidatus Micrarchaeota archaeon]|nr:hypothetical protein [Candidatus Micrarchaeota archaeon]MBU1930459.1 hypothetical protein [Candidatus Micrarchaeota archaeon]
MSAFFFSFCIAFILTNLIEFFPFHFLIQKPLKQKIVALFVINLITLSGLWLVLPFFYQYYLFFWVVLEVLVIIVETFLIKAFLQQPIQIALRTAVLMNVLSAVIGLLFF